MNAAKNTVVKGILAHLWSVYRAGADLDTKRIDGSVVIIPDINDADQPEREDEEFFSCVDTLKMVEIIYHPLLQRIDIVCPHEAERTPLSRQPQLRTVYVGARGGSWRHNFQMSLQGIVNELNRSLVYIANVAAWVIEESDVFYVSGVFASEHHAKIHVGIKDWPHGGLCVGIIEIFYNDETSAFIRIKNKNGYQTQVIQNNLSSVEIGDLIRSWMQTPYRNGITVVGREPDYQFIVPNEKTLRKVWPELIEAKSCEPVDYAVENAIVSRDPFGHAQKFHKKDEHVETYFIFDMDNMTNDKLHRWSAEDATP